jgi:hypothetical protein
MEQKCRDLSKPDMFDHMKALVDELQKQFTFEGMGIDPNGPPVRFDDEKNLEWQRKTESIIECLRGRIDCVESRVVERLD